MVITFREAQNSPVFIDFNTYYWQLREILPFKGPDEINPTISFLKLLLKNIW